MSSSNNWGIGDVGQVSMSELTEKMGMLMVPAIIDDKFTVENECWQDDERNIKGNLCILGMDDIKLVIITSASCSTSILSI